MGTLKLPMILHIAWFCLYFECSLKRSFWCRPSDVNEDEALHKVAREWNLWTKFIKASTVEITTKAQDLEVELRATRCRTKQWMPWDILQTQPPYIIKLGSKWIRISIYKQELNGKCFQTFSTGPLKYNSALWARYGKQISSTRGYYYGGIWSKVLTNREHCLDTFHSNN